MRKRLNLQRVKYKNINKLLPFINFGMFIIPFVSQCVRVSVCVCEINESVCLNERERERVCVFDINEGWGIMDKIWPLSL